MLTIPPKIRFLGPVSHYVFKIYTRELNPTRPYRDCLSGQPCAMYRPCTYLGPVPPHASDRRFDGTSRRGRPSSALVAARPAVNGESATVARAVATKSPSTDGLDAVQPSRGHLCYTLDVRGRAHGHFVVYKITPRSDKI